MTYRAAGGCGRKISWGNGTENGLPGLCGPFVLLSLSRLLQRSVEEKTEQATEKTQEKGRNGFSGKSLLADRGNRR